MNSPSAISSPSIIASTREALRIIVEEPQLRTQLWDNANQLYDGLKALGLPVGPTASPVVAVEMEDRSATIECWNALVKAGVRLTVIDIDPFVLADESPSDILSGRILMTIVNGEVVFEQ